MSATKEAIVALHCAGISNTVIAETLSLQDQCFIERGDFSDRQRSGRPRSKR